MSKVIPMMKLTEHEQHLLKLAHELASDALRQGAWSLVDAQIRARLKISERRYYTWNDAGDVKLDMSRERISPVKKLSKSDL